MFKLKRPCANCPFLKSQGKNFNLGADRVREIVHAPAFQCHKTVDYDAEEGSSLQGDKPQQCAGLMSVLHKSGQPNQIMRVAERISDFDATRLDHDLTYDSIEQAIEDHA